MFGEAMVPDKTPCWSDSTFVCAFSDEDRHLGHIVLKGGLWYAFDATHMNDAGDGFRNLGSFPSINVAKAAVESSCAQAPQVKRMWVS
jgi:hypothetical protein